MYGYSEQIDWGQFTDATKAYLDELPHGSGIDCDWHATLNTTGKVVAHNSYHVMNEWGSYVGWADFSIRWAPGNFDTFRLMFHGPESQYLARYYGLRDYLEDVLYATRDYVPESARATG